MDWKQKQQYKPASAEHCYKVKDDVVARVNFRFQSEEKKYSQERWVNKRLLFTSLFCLSKSFQSWHYIAFFTSHAFDLHFTLENCGKIKSKNISISVISWICCGLNFCSILTTAKANKLLESTLLFTNGYLWCQKKRGSNRVQNWT